MKGRRKGMLTPKEFATHYDVTYGAVLIWIRTGKVKAERHETLRGPTSYQPRSSKDSSNQEQAEDAKPLPEMLHDV
jgi:hypothetical protein